MSTNQRFDTRYTWLGMNVTQYDVQQESGVLPALE